MAKKKNKNVFIGVNMSIKEISKITGYSISTVSNALNGSPKVTDETREKIEKVADSLNYIPNSMARGLKLKKTHLIALILSDVIGPFYNEIIQGVKQGITDKGYDLIICPHFGTQTTAERFLLEGRLDGAIILAPNLGSHIIRRAAENGTKIVVLDRELIAENISNVLINNQQGIQKAVEHLIVQGYRKIGFVSGAHSYDSEKRFEGYIESIEREMLYYNERHIFSGDFTKQSGIEIAKEVVKMKEWPEALVVSNDEMAVGIYEELVRSGIKVPGDIALTGFDDIELARYLKTPLTTVGHPTFKLGNIATEKIFSLIENGEPTYQLLDSELIIRKSSIRKG